MTLSLGLLSSAPISKSSSVVGDSDAGAAAGARSEDRVSSAIPETTPPSDAKKLFFEFLSRYLGVIVFAIQPGFKNSPDTYLFRGPHGTSMNVPTSIMLLDQTTALQLIQERIVQKKKAFETGAA